MGLQNHNKIWDFEGWLVDGIGSCKGGIARLKSIKILLAVLSGVAFGMHSQGVSPVEFADKIALVLLSIIIGAVLSTAATVQSQIQDPILEEMLEHTEGSFQNIVYVYCMKVAMLGLCYFPALLVSVKFHETLLPELKGLPGITNGLLMFCVVFALTLGWDLIKSIFELSFARIMFRQAKERHAEEQIAAAGTT